MTRSSIWIWIVLSGVAYQALRAIFGLELTPMTLFDSAYWSGAALGIHWAAEQGYLGK